MEKVKAWKQAKQAFTAVVLKEATPKLGRERLVAPVVDKYDALIMNEATELDDIENDFETQLHKKDVTADLLNQLLSHYTTLNNTLTGNVATMMQKLQAGIEHFKTEDAPGNPKMKENMIRGLKVLKTQADAISKSSDSWLSMARSRVADRGKEVSAHETMAKQFAMILRAAVARGLAAAQKVKADPTAKTWNSEFPKAARDITQQIGNVKKLTEKGFMIPGPQDPSALFTALKPFADGEYLNIDKALPSDQVLQLASRFNKAVKAVADAYNIQ